jgi:hypothetical protein
MAPSRRLTGRAHLIDAVKAPIALFALALSVIEVILCGLGASRSLGNQGSLILASGMVASLLITLFGFLITLFLRPSVLFTRGPEEEAIAAFGRLGDQLTANDIKILTKMLGSGANYFSWFCVSAGQNQDATSLSKRKAKLEKLNFIEKVGSSEVQLTMLGTQV